MNSAKILIAGESQTSNSMRQLVLEAAGYVVVAATDVFSALEAARLTTFQLAVVDGLLPLASVQHLLRVFRSRGIPTLLLAPRDVCEPLLPLASVALPFDDAYTLPRIVESLLLNPPKIRDVAVPLGIGVETASAGDHLAWLCVNDADCEKAVRFLEVGFQQDETGIVLGTEPQKERLSQLLQAHGFNPGKLMESNRLRWIDVASAQLSEAWLTEVREVVTSRSSLVRVMASMGLGQGGPSESELLRFETQLDAVLHDTRSMAACLYNLNCVSAKQLFFAGLGQHSLIVTPNGVVRESLSLGTSLL